MREGLRRSLQFRYLSLLNLRCCFNWDESVCSLSAMSELVLLVMMLPVPNLRCSHTVLNRYCANNHKVDKQVEDDDSDERPA